MSKASLELADLTPANQAIVHRWERSYVEMLNACKASARNDADYWRWNGHAAQLRICLTDFRVANELPAVAYGSREWRTRNGVA
jgi:hypothetical protein